MLRCAARGRADLMDFEAIDPYKLLHGIPTKSIDEELAEIPANVHLFDDALEDLVGDHVARLERREARGRTGLEHDSQEAWQAKGGATIEDLYANELDFYRKAGPVTWEENGNGQ